MTWSSAAATPSGLTELPMGCRPGDNATPSSVGSNSGNEHAPYRWQARGREQENHPMIPEIQIVPDAEAYTVTGPPSLCAWRVRLS